MKKNIFILSLVTVLMFLLVGCQKEGKTDNAKVDLGKSDVYSEQEREDAVEAVKEKFKEFTNCELTKIWYDEITELASSTLKDKNKIVLYTDFKTGDVEKDSGLTKNSKVNGWSWTLQRDNKDDEWRIVDYGEG